MEWEYATERWVFIGAERDDWPGRSAWEAGGKEPSSGGIMLRSFQKDTEVGQRLRWAYYDWRDEQEQQWLNAMGAAGFELVAVYRDEDWGPGDFRYDFPIVTINCYFKRPRAPNAVLPEKPRIGFRPREE